jgi:5-methylcytosine-specific restriction enzyme subunit McrC
MLYASDLTRFHGSFKALIDDDQTELPDLIARLLTTTVERRIRRNLTNGFQRRESINRRVRGRIDVLKTESGQLLSKGEVFCRFETLTVNTIRNRFILAALHLAARIVNDRDLAHRCRCVATDLARLGVSGVRPSRAELTSDQLGRNDAADRLMVALARLMFDLVSG